ncbi:MAG TPA: hypothetical protein VFZ24_09250 [Longimicrobiales bacterium]
MHAYVRTPFLVLALATAACDRVPGDPLDTAEAAVLLERMRLAAAGDAPLPGLGELADLTAGRVAAEHHELVTAYRTLRSAADAALLTGDPERAQDAVTAARDAQLRVVLAGLGSPGVAELIAQAQHRVRQLEPRLHDGFDHVARLGQMNASADDMLKRARARLLQGDDVGALDLSAHAIDLLNAVDAALDEQ